MSIELGVIKRHPLKKKWAVEPESSAWLATDGLDRISTLLDIDLCNHAMKIRKVFVKYV